MTKEDTRLIETAFPLKRASMDSVHEKNVRHGHISTLHIWAGEAAPGCLQGRPHRHSIAGPRGQRQPSVPPVPHGRQDRRKD